MERRRTSNRKRGAVLVGVLALGGVTFATTQVAADAGALRASTELQDGLGETIGFARFVQDAGGSTHVNVHVRGMTQGLHGIHVHAVGSCSSENGTFSGAGPHYGAPGSLHGGHTGDLPNLTVNVAGLGHLNSKLAHFTLTGGSTGLFDGDGSALIVHAMADDYVTNPSGNSGARIACGVIQPE
jgi:Cu-Zn family superoxide dismutase